MVKLFEKSANQPNKIALCHLQFDFPLLFSADKRLQEMVRKFHFRRPVAHVKTRTTSGARENEVIMGCLPFVRINQLVRPLNNVRVFFPKSANQPNEMALTICNSISRMMRDWELESVYQILRKFSPFRFERKKRSTSGGSLQFPNGFFRILLFPLTFNRGGPGV